MTVTESRMHRIRLGDIVEYHDLSTWPPTVLTGPVVAFANEVGSYLNVKFTTSNSEVFADDALIEKTLTEDEVKRVA